MRMSDWCSDVCSSDLFGCHRLTIAREDEKIILLVERIDELSQSSKDVDEAKAFSLAGVMPGKRMGAWVFGLLMRPAFLIGPIWAWSVYKHLNDHPDGSHDASAWLAGPLPSAPASMNHHC